MDNLGRKMKKLRTSRNMSQNQLAALLGVSGKCISRYEKNQSEPRIDLILKMCEIFNVDANYLLGIKNVYRAKNVVITKQDFEILDNYHKLNDDMRHIVDCIFNTNKPKEEIKSSIMYLSEN